MSKDKPLTPEEEAEYMRNVKALREAYAKDPEGATEALKAAIRDFQDFPTQSGEL